MEDGALQHGQDSLDGPKLASSDETPITKSTTSIPPITMAAAQGGDQGFENDDGHRSPLFVSQGSLTPGKSMPDHANDQNIRCKCGIAVVVPPVERPWEYRVFPDERRVSEIVEEIEDSVELQYLVMFEDGHEAQVREP